MKPYDECKAIVELDLDPIKVKLMHKESGEGWTAAQANAVETEYRRFLYLTKTHPEEAISPTADVDTFWHYHILDTMKYAHDCSAVFGYFLHHFPYVGMRGEDDERARHEMDQRTRALYAQAFGEQKDETTKAFCSVTTESDAAFCSMTAQAAAGSAAAPGDDLKSFCSVAAVKPAFCSVAASKPTFCSVAASKPAFCSVAASKPAFCSVAAVKPAFCSVAAAKSAFCSVAASNQAFCSVATASAPFCSVAARPAFCSVAAKPAVRAMNVKPAFCSVAAKPAFCSVSSGGSFCSVNRQEDFFSARPRFEEEALAA